MQGFRNTTKMKMCHDVDTRPRAPGTWHGQLKRTLADKFQSGGLVIPRPSGAGGIGRSMRPMMPATRPIMPRPRVMPNIKAASMRPHRMFAHGGAIKMTAEPRETGSAVERRGGRHAYSNLQREYPDSPKLRPGYRKGGIHIKPQNRGKFTKEMTGSKSGKLTDKDVSRGLHSGSAATRRRANFARMARRHFKPLTKGGVVCKAEGGSLTFKKWAQQEAAEPAHRGGRKNLAFMSKPLFGSND